MKFIEKSSSAVNILEKVWRALREKIDDLPEARIIIEGTRSRSRGYFHVNGWKYSQDAGHVVGIKINELSNSKQVLMILLHEAVHAVNFVRGIADVKKDYHNKHFKSLAIEFGLRVEFRNTRCGFTDTYYQDDIKTRFPKAFRILSGSFNVGKPSVCEQQAQTPKSGHVILFCRCKPKRRLSMTPSMWEKGAVVCSECNAVFSLPTIT